MDRHATIWMIRLPPAAAPTLNQPLGFMMLAAALRRAGYRKLRIFDLAPEHLPEERVLRALENEQPEVIFFTACTVDLPALARFACAARARSPESSLVVGGPHPTSDPQGTLESVPELDVAVIGEGEVTVTELLPALSPGGSADLDQVAGIAHRLEGEIRLTSPRANPPTLDDDLWPAYDLINVRAYYRYPRMGVLYRHRAYMSLFTSRGCPYRCTYCHGIFGREVRSHSAARVVEEFDYLAKKHDIREIQLLDDLFNHDTDRTLAIAEGISRRVPGACFSAPNGLRGDRLTDEEVVALARAGCWRVCLAVETATERLQHEIRKHLDLDRVREVIALCDAQGLLTQGFFMLGFPGETAAEIEATVRWAESSALHLGLFFRVIPMPGCALREQARAAGCAVDREPYAYEGNGTSFNLSTLSDVEMEHAHRDAIRRFYSQPKRLARLMRVLPKHPALLPAYAYEGFTRLGLGTTGPHLLGKLLAPAGARRAWRWWRTGNVGARDA